MTTATPDVGHPTVTSHPATYFLWVLVAVHLFLGVWAVVGFTEWFAADVPWTRVSNPLFPRGILFMQWALVLGAAVLFIGGYATRWRTTPVAMAIVYAGMASLCAVQTFRYMESDSRFLAMGLEYVAYAVILIFLFRSEFFGSKVRM